MAAIVVAHRRASSESAASFDCSCYGRGRLRASNLDYEMCKDQLALWVGSWDTDTICGFLNEIVVRCSLHQLEYLWTALESVPHRDFLSSPEVLSCPRPYTPLSTPVSRNLTTRIARSHKPQNKRLFRAPSTVINSKVEPKLPSDIQFSSTLVVPESTNPTKLPGVQHSTPLVYTPIQHRANTSNKTQRTPRRTPTPFARSLSCPPVRVQSPLRRHMFSSCDSPSLNTPTPLPTSTSVITRRTFLCAPTKHCAVDSLLSPEALKFLSWFKEHTQDWQQQELLQLLVASLNHKELYFLATLLKSRQYRDFISQLPEVLLVRVLAFLPAKDILRNCCLVSKCWSSKCSTDAVWKVKVKQRRMGLPISNFLSFKGLYLDDLRLKRNWVRGVCSTRDFTSTNSHKVLCIRLSNGVIATGSSDRVVRLWKLSTGGCVCKLRGHLKAVWSVCFYGKRFVISGSGDRTIKIWNYRTGVCERTLSGHEGNVWALQQREDVLISGGNDKMAILWDVRHCSPRVRLEGHQGGVFGVELDQDASTAFTCSGDKTICRWDVASGACLSAVTVSRTSPVMTLHWDQGYLVAGSGSIVTVWDADTMERVTTFQGHSGRVESVQLTVYSACPVLRGMVLSASQDKSIKYWDLHSAKCVRTLRGHEHRITSCVYDDICIVSADSTSLRVWDFHPHKNTTDDIL